MARQSRKTISKAYKVVYGLDEAFQLREKDDDIINHAAIGICRWQGYFPGETNDTETVNARELDKKATTGDISDLCTYFKKLGVYDNDKSQWENIFYLYKEYVQNDPDGRNHPISTGYEEKLADVPRDDQQIEENLSEMVDSNANDPLSIKIPQEEKRMAVDGKTTVGEAMGNDLAGAAKAATGTASAILGQTGTIKTNVGTPSKDDAAKAAEKFAQSTEKDRKAYAAANKIKLFVISQEPLTKRIPENISTGTVSDPKSKRDKVLEKVWAGQAMPDGMINGMVNGEIIVPDSVASINQSKEYQTFMAELNEACKDQNYAFEIRRSDKLAAFSGVQLIENGKMNCMKWTDLKQLVYDKTMAQLFVEGGSDILVQLGKARRTEGKVIESVTDLLVLNVVGKNDLIDTATGTIKDSAHVTFAYKTTEQIVNDKTGVRSKLTFKYLKKSTADNGEVASRKTNVNLTLNVPQFETVLAGPEFEPLKRAKGVGNTVSKLDQNAAQVLMTSLFSDAIIEGKADGNLQTIIQDTKAATQAADAQSAAQMAGSGQF